MKIDHDGSIVTKNSPASAMTYSFEDDEVDSRSYRRNTSLVADSRTTTIPANNTDHLLALHENDSNQEEDSVPIESSNNTNNFSYLKTYTAGEDNGRLAAMAKELGLAKSRQPRRQIRQEENNKQRRRSSVLRTNSKRQNSFVHIPKRRHTTHQRSHSSSSDNINNLNNNNNGNNSNSRRRNSVAANVWKSLLQTTVEDARMLAVYSAHDEFDNDSNFSENNLNLYESSYGPLLERVVHNTLMENDDNNNLHDGIQNSQRNNDIDHSHEVDGSGDLTSAVLGIIRGMVGPAILYLPHGFANAGYYIAIPLLLLSTFFFLYSSSCLLESWKYEHDKHKHKKKKKKKNNNNNINNANDSRQKKDTEKQNIDNTIENNTNEQSPLLRLYNNNDESSNDVFVDDDDDNYIDDTNDEDVMLSYPELAYRALGNVGESIVKIGIASMQSGVCLTYLIFVPKNLHNSILYLFHKNIEPIHWLIVMIIIQIPLSFIHDIRKLTPTNLLANILILYGLCICIGYSIIQCIKTTSTTSIISNTTILTTTTTLLTSTDDVHPFTTIQDAGFGGTADSHNNNPMINLWNHLKNLTPYAPNWILFIGTSVFLFEGSITLLVPLQESVVVVFDDDEGAAKISKTNDEQQQQYDGDKILMNESAESLFPKVNTITILCIIMFYTFFGIVCWMAYGDDVNVVFTTSLPSNALTTSVQLAYSIAVIFTFPLQNFPASEIIAKSILSFISRNKSNTMIRNLRLNNMTERMQRNIISTCIVLLLAVLAVFTMESLDKVVSLLGSLFGCPIAFIIPPIIHSRLVIQKQVFEDETVINNSESKNRIFNARRRQLMNYIAIVFGLIAMILASSITIINCF